MEALQAWFTQLDYDRLWMMLITAGACLLCISFHEMCHGWAALMLGDQTAKRAGRLTLNPLRHIDLLGLVMLLTVRFGWAKPVPVDMRNFKNPKAGMAITALAGPVSNVLLSGVSLSCYAVCAFYNQLYGGSVIYYLGTFFLYTASLSAGLAVFNLLPVPPLDGSKILFALLPDELYAKLMRYERYGGLILMALLLIGVLDGPLIALRTGILDVLSQVCLWPFDLLASIYF